ncbi:MAG TPA: hypothetical protein VEJ38_11390 [Candidatus Acidoferrales bacterium]|nr:hypothetical protein [Candidatus Acidoferrales bacterium]
MRYAAGLLGAILVFALNLHAQVNPNYSLPQISSTDSEAGPALTSEAGPLLALAIPPELAAPGELHATAPSSPATSDSGAQQQPPSVYGVFQEYNWQVYAGYSFMRFYLLSKPDTILTMNGLDVGAVYYIPKITWLGAEGQFVGEYGSFIGNTAKLAVGMGGIRARWSAPRGIEVWAHGLIGGSKFVPRTAFGNETALAYEAGGGVDVGAHHRRLAYRLELDMLGTRFFSTYQYSPRISVGIVFKF